MEVLIERYQKYMGFFDETYTYKAVVGNVTLESKVLLDLVVFLGLSGHPTKLSFINEDEYK